MLALCAALFAVLVIVTDDVEGRTITVDDDGGADYTKIQAAIDAAEDGDTVRVYEGTYYGNVIVNKSIDLVGDGSEATTIDGQGTNSVVRVESEWVNMSGFKVTGSGDDGIDSGILALSSNHCYIHDVNVTGTYNGIYLSRCSYSSIIGCTFSNIEKVGVMLYGDGYGGHHIVENVSIVGCNRGIKIDQMDNFIRNCSIVQSKVGIELSNGHRTSIEDCTINDSVSGIKVGSMDRVSISDCRISNCSKGVTQGNGEDFIIENSVLEDSRSMGLELGKARVENCTLENNFQGLVITDPVSIRNNSFIKCGLYTTIRCDEILNNRVNGKPLRYLYGEEDLEIVEDSGQIIMINCNSVQVSNQDISNTDTGILVLSSSYCTIQDSRIDGSSRNGLYISGSDNIFVENCVMNNSGRYGLYLSGDSIEITGCTVSNSSECGIKGSGDNHKILDSTVMDQNYGTSLEGCDNLLMSDCTVQNNFYEGIRLIDGTSCDINGCTIDMNGVGIALHGEDNTVFDCIIQNNTNRGASIGKTADLVWSTIRYNQQGVYFSGSSTERSISNCNIYRNTAYGVDTQDGLEEPVNCTNNWWGDSSGPHHTGNNPAGKGDKVTGHVTFEPWYIQPFDYFKPVAYFDSIFPDPVSKSEVIHFSGNGTVWESVENYVWASSINGEFYNGTGSEFDYSDLSVGEHIIILKIQDNFGIWSNNVTTTLEIRARTFPTITISSPANNSKNSGTVTIAGSASNPDGMIRKVEISINSGEWKNVTGIDPTGIDPWSYQWDSSAVTDGDYKIKVRAYDGEEYSEVLVWNLEVKNDDGGDDDSPAFGTALLAAAFVVALIRRNGNGTT